MKVVFDTNVYVLAFLLSGSLAEEAFLRIQRNRRRSLPPSRF